MHILLIHQVFVSPTEPGGTRHYEFACHCAAQGNNFTIVAGTLDYQTGEPIVSNRRLVFEQKIGPVRVLRAYMYPSLHRSFAWRVVTFISFMFTSIWAALQAGPVDLIMGTSPPIFQAVSAWLVALIRRRPFLLEVRDLWPDFAIEMGVLKNPILIKISRWLENFLYARATHLLVNSPAYRDYLLNKGIPADKISLIPNGVDPEMFDPEAKGEAVRGDWNLDGHFVVTYAGALGLANDIPTILRAAQRLRDYPDIHFLLVGDGKERAALETLAHQLQLSNVTFTGSRPKSEISAILAASNICTATLQNIPLFKTTYPNKIFDYMAAGRPVVLAIDGVIRQVIEVANGGVFAPPGDDKALAEAVLWLYCHPADAKKMGQAARSYVVKHFNRKHHAEEFVELVKHIIDLV